MSTPLLAPPPEPAAAPRGALAARLLAPDRRPAALALVVATSLAVVVVVETARTSVVDPYRRITTVDGEVAVWGSAPSWVDPVRDAAPWLSDALPVLAWLGALSVVAGLFIAVRDPVPAVVLAALPVVLCTLLAGTFLLSWWWGLAGVAVVTAVRRLRSAVPTYVLAVGAVAAFNAEPSMAILTSGGPVHATGGPAGWWTVVGFAAYLGAAVTVAAALGAALRYGAATAWARAVGRRAELDRSVTAERSRLARDLHDVVAHHMSLAAVRAESAPFVHPDLDGRATDVLRSVASDARSALAELRQVIAVLERAQDAPAAPQAGVADVDALVDAARTAGQDVVMIGRWDGVPATTGYVLYRVVQEALSNARRHAPGSSVAVIATSRDGGVGVVVENAANHPADEPGTGLIGMRERVAALGGTVTAGAVDGAFRLVVDLPTGDCSDAILAADGAAGRRLPTGGQE
ncbi:histidine kinase [Cellulomonas sp. SLBN-39]|uniref:sensor histidine kinase n=1 Tax=Cellulomonas sp. SLBN-39 TaxID=2768446 RepID=UPI0011516CC0|nr:histidine kinase [Cellulomonas sp. SLBN-39]TQL01922.1 signal transduction histidine kinase [Cellulomonas sp. SLBN-39]